jgi:hypothetical protein
MRPGIGSGGSRVEKAIRRPSRVGKELLEPRISYETYECRLVTGSNPNLFMLLSIALSKTGVELPFESVLDARATNMHIALILEPK